MNGFAIAAPLVLLLSAPVFAQAPQPKPAPPAGQATPKPAQPAPAQPPAAQAAPPLAPPAPFPQGAKVGLVNLQQIAQLSADGKAATGKIQALIQKKQAEGAQKSKTLQDNQAKLAQGGALLNETARTQLEKEIEKQTVEGQRFEQDAQAEVTELQNQLQGEFQRKLFPILQQLLKEKELHLLLSAADAGVIAAEPGIDVTAEAIKRLDASQAPRPAAAPAAPKQ
jgi:Skp family chaperone for outer membrane proteins